MGRRIIPAAKMIASVSSRKMEERIVSPFPSRRRKKRESLERLGDAPIINAQLMGGMDMMISGDQVLADPDYGVLTVPRDASQDEGEFLLRCPACHEEIVGVYSVEGKGVGDPTFDEHVVYHCCPKCHTILNVEIDPLMLLRRTEGHLRHTMRQASGRFS